MGVEPAFARIGHSDRPSIDEEAGLEKAEIYLVLPAMISGWITFPRLSRNLRLAFHARLGYSDAGIT